jgi:hypothetical protein
MDLSWLASGGEDLKAVKKAAAGLRRAAVGAFQAAEGCQHDADHAWEAHHPVSGQALLEMLCLTGGRPRTVTELRILLAAANYKVTSPKNRSDSTAKYVEAEAL